MSMGNRNATGGDPGGEFIFSKHVSSVATVGLCIYVLMCVFATWRTVVLLGRTGVSPLITGRKCFHYLIVMLSALSAVPWAWSCKTGILVEDSTGYLPRELFMCRTMGDWMMLVAVSVVITVWSEALRSVRNKHRFASVRFILVAFNSGVFTLCMLTCLYMEALPPDVRLGDFLNTDISVRVLAGAMAGGLLMCCCGVLFYGVTITVRIFRTHTEDPLYYSERLRHMVYKLDVAMVLCCGAFLLRTMYFMRLVSNTYYQTPSSTTEFLVAEWIPKMVPAYVLLLLMRSTLSSPAGRGGAIPITPVVSGLDEHSGAGDEVKPENGSGGGENSDEEVGRVSMESLTLLPPREEASGDSRGGASTSLLLGSNRFSGTYRTFTPPPPKSGSMLK